MKINIEIQDETSATELENVIDSALNDAGVECFYEVEKENKEKATEKPKSMLSQIKALGTQSSKDVAKDTPKKEQER